jgi:hypothetical protein
MNISDYTLSELMAIIEIEDLTPSHIVENTNFYIKKYKVKDPKLSVFFQDVQSQLLQYAQGIDDNEPDNNDEGKIVVESFGNMANNAIYPSGDKQISDWYQNENLTQSDKNQANKITDRKQKIQLFGNESVPMKREQIATTDTYNLPVKQDSLNPNLKNTINRFLNLDSQFRQYTTGIDSTSTNYTCDLSDTLKNTLKLSLYSYQIPFSWYAIDVAYGNTCFWIYDQDSGNYVSISIPPGNYSQTSFQTQLNTSFNIAGFSQYPDISSNIPDISSNIITPVNYNQNSGMITLYLYGSVWHDPDPDSSKTFTVSENTQIIFFDFTASLQCNINCSTKSNHYFNSTLGWIMGYRLPYVNVVKNTTNEVQNGNEASAILDLNGTKYLILVIDDYNQNHINNSLVSISQFSNTLKIPSYYSPDLPYTCLNPGQNINNLNELIDGVVTQSLFDTQSFNTGNGSFTPGNYINTSNQALNGLLIGGKYENDYTSTQIVLPSAPRTLTNAQLYTINSINNNNNNITNYLAKAPTSSDILAIIPVKTSTGVPTGSLLVEFSGSLQDSSRTYFGPVNIDRLAVKLLDDKGNILNLNGNDWCVTIIAECLYQY